MCWIYSSINRKIWTSHNYISKAEVFFVFPSSKAEVIVSVIIVVLKFES